MSQPEPAWWSRWIASFRVADLQGSYLFAALALWHSYGMWMAACINITVGAVLLVRWDISWLLWTRRQVCRSVQGCCREVGFYGPFLAAFMRSYLIILFVSELLRFCFWLMRDAWRADAFEGYRRYLCGHGGVELQHGSMYCVGWSSMVLQSKSRWVDRTAQCCIYLSFDVVPIVSGVVAYMVYGATPFSAGLVAAQALSAAAAAHVLLFYAAWTATDVWLKVQAFGTAWAHSNPLAVYTCAEGENRFQKLEDEDGENGLLPNEQHDTHHSKQQSVADQLSIGAPLCSLLRFLIHHGFWLTLVIVGSLWHSEATVLAGICFATLCIVYSLATSQWCTGPSETLKHLPRSMPKRAQRLHSLRGWGETHCGLSYPELLDRSFVWVWVVALHIIMFMSFGWWTLAIISALVLLVVAVQHWVVRCYLSVGWLVSISSNVLVALATSILGYTFPTSPRWEEGWPSLILLLLHCLRQFGLGRHNHDSMMLQHATTLCLTGFKLFIVAVVLGLFGQDVSGETSFCDRAEVGCKYFPVPYLMPNQTRHLACAAWFSLGAKNYEFSIPDFGLLSKLAYEPDVETMQSALQQYFPGWRVSHKHWAAVNTGWSSFFEFASPDNATSVIAVRGTNTALDILNDVVLWTPAAVMQFFGLIGPEFLPLNVMPVAMARIVDFFDGSNNYTSFFMDLLGYVTRRISEEPQREFFLTGHSLGGGLATLVAAETGVRAVTFMAPGVSVTSHVVFQRFSSKASRPQVVTVQPEYDVFSRLDTQQGLVVPLACKASNKAFCHLIGPALCEMFRQCGSGHLGKTIFLPEALCAMPDR